jgi:hypothetical protein
MFIFNFEGKLNQKHLKKTKINSNVLFFESAYWGLFSLLRLFNECICFNQQIFYLTRDVKQLTQNVSYKFFAQGYAEEKNVFWGVSNQQSLVGSHVKENSEALLLLKAGLVCNFSLFFTSRSGLRYLRNSENALASVGLHAGIDYPLYLQDEDADQFLLTFFQRVGFLFSKKNNYAFFSFLVPLFLKNLVVLAEKKKKE